MPDHYPHFMLENIYIKTIDKITAAHATLLPDKKKDYPNGPKLGSLEAIIGLIKSAVSKHCPGYAIIHIYLYGTEFFEYTILNEAICK